MTVVGSGTQWICRGEVINFPTVTYYCVRSLLFFIAAKLDTQCPLVGHWVMLQMRVEMSVCAKYLNWLCFCVYRKGWSEYSTIGGHSGSSVNIMTDKSTSARVGFDACENCSKPLMDGKNDRTAAMVSQAEIWQEDKKFTVRNTVCLIMKLPVCV